MIGDDDENYFEVEHNESSPIARSDFTREKMSQGKVEYWKTKKSERSQTIVSEFKRVHGNKYDYSKVVYETQNKKVIVICPIHGEFLTNPKWHWNGNGGCPECRKIKISDAIRGTRRVASDLDEIRDLRERDYTIQEIQDKLGLSRGTVQRRLEQIKKG